MDTRLYPGNRGRKHAWANELKFVDCDVFVLTLALDHFCLVQVGYRFSKPGIESDMIFSQAEQLSSTQEGMQSLTGDSSECLQHLDCQKGGS
jgi:hypothetical protein